MQVKINPSFAEEMFSTAEASIRRIRCRVNSSKMAQNISAMNIITQTTYFIQVLYKTIFSADNPNYIIRLIAGNDILPISRSVRDTLAVADAHCPNITATMPWSMIY